MTEVEYSPKYVLEKEEGGFSYLAIEMSEGLTVCRLRNLYPMDLTIVAPFILESSRKPPSAVSCFYNSSTQSRLIASRHSSLMKP